MTRETDRRNLIKEAVEAFRRGTGIEATVEIGDAGIDALMRIEKGQKTWRFEVEVKPWLTPATIGLIAQRRHEKPGKWVVITRHAPIILAGEMKKLGIAFVDTAGNALIDEPGLFIYIKGQKLQARHVTWGVGRPFRPAGMQVIFALLCNPGLEHRTYRDIAEAAMTALGTINWTMRGLKIAGYLIEMQERGRRLVRRKELLEKWVATYPDQLRPRQLIGRFTTPEPDWWKGVELLPHNALWGGEVAAAITTQYLNPERVTIYAEENVHDLILRHKLRNDPKGEIEILKKFWYFCGETPERNTVPPLLVYADLIGTGNERNIETARKIYEQDLRQYLEQTQ
jgi:hypothetical protein